MAKAARMAKVDTKSIGTLVRSLTVICGVLCFGVLTLALIHRLLPFLQILLPGLVGWWLWRRCRIGQDRQHKRLHTVFYHLLREHHGQIMLLDFAMTAEIPAIAARHYLDRRAQEFAARFEVTEQGDVVYVFSSLQFSRRLPSPADMPATVPAGNASTSALPLSLTQTELAKRLGVATKTISRKKHSPLLGDWTQTRDPDGTSWSYDTQAQRFFPLDDRVSTPLEKAP